MKARVVKLSGNYCRAGYYALEIDQHVSDYASTGVKLQMSDSQYSFLLRSLVQEAGVENPDPVDHDLPQDHPLMKEWFEKLARKINS